MVSSSSAARQPDRSKTRMVTFARATEKVTGFLAAPRDTRRHRAIIVIHEWWGLNEWVKEQAEKLAGTSRLRWISTRAKSRPILLKPANSSAVFGKSTRLAI